MRAIMQWAAALGVATMCSRGEASIQIVKNNGQAVPDGAATVAFNPATGGWDITLLQLYAPNFDTVYEIRADGGETIDNIFININGPSAGSPLIVRALGFAPGYLRSVHNIVQGGTAETILNKVNVLEDIGSVQVESIGDLVAGRDVVGPVFATTADNATRGISNVRAGRNIVGDITADNGRILLVSAPQGNIGTPSTPLTIRAKHDVFHIEAREVYANINARYNGGAGGIFALDVQKFIGSLTAEKLKYNSWLSMDGLIYITQQFSGSITLGKSFNGATQYIQVPQNGLGGQIIINADNAGGGAWTSPVRVGPQGNPNQIVLTNPSYAQTPAALGGGSVGLVPFRLHSQACVPANGAMIMQSPGQPPVAVQLRHYGPVTWASAPALTIERRSAGTAQNFVPLQAADFTTTRLASNSNVITIVAAPGKPGFTSGFEYRIRPTSQLRCEVPGSPPVQWASDYTFTVVVPACNGDINNDAIVNVSDLLMVISFWGPTQPTFTAPDVDHNGVVNVNDLLYVIGHWGSCW